MAENHVATVIGSSSDLRVILKGVIRTGVGDRSAIEAENISFEDKRTHIL